MAVKLKCQRCARVWSYKGKNPYYGQCSFCKSSVNIKKAQVL